MFVRQKKNKSGSVSIQIISKTNGKYKVVETIGCTGEYDEIERLVIQAKYQINRYSNQPKLLSIKSPQELAVEAFIHNLSIANPKQIEQIIFSHTKRLLNGQIQVVFYDLTTLYFETESEDDLRKTGFSKDGKFHHPQLVLGLLTTTAGYPLGYELFSGNIFEGKTLIPAIRQLEKKFGLDKPVVVADAGLLSETNLHALSAENCQV